MSCRLTGFLLNLAGLVCVLAAVELYSLPLGGLGAGLCVWAGTYLEK